MNTPRDHGSDPLGNGKFRMVPSGDTVDREERDRRLGKPNTHDNPPRIFGLTHDEIAEKQGGGKLKP